MTTPHEFSVNASSAASINVPVTVVPGIAGIEARSTIIAGHVALVLAALTAMVGMSIRNREALGTFRPEAKAQIEQTLATACEASERQRVARCGELAWHGKHRWFGKIELQGFNGPPERSDVERMLGELGWTHATTSGDAVSFERGDMELSIYAPRDGVRTFIATTAK
ncbi:hypothetical protein [Roseateles noduli]|uniref:hypothetical protein n=1 Tax=Roseateles noduli TaxID=2052484 RepID=UPI003D64A95D